LFREILDMLVRTRLEILTKNVFLSWLGKSQQKAKISFRNLDQKRLSVKNLNQKRLCWLETSAKNALLG